MPCIQNNQLCCLEGCTVLLKQQVRCFNPKFPLWRWCNRSIWLLNTSVWVFSPLWLGVTHCNFPELLWEAACLSGMLVLLLFLSGGEWWASTCLPNPKCGCRDRQWCGAAVPSQEIVLGQPWHWGALGRDAAVVVVLWVLGEPKVSLVLFYCALLCSLWILSFGKWECSEKNIWSCWVRRKPYQQLIWMGITVVDGRWRLWYVMSNSCLSSIVFSECFLTIF